MPGIRVSLLAPGFIELVAQLPQVYWPNLLKTPGVYGAEATLSRKFASGPVRSVYVCSDGESNMFGGTRTESSAHKKETRPCMTTGGPERETLSGRSPGGFVPPG